MDAAVVWTLLKDDSFREKMRKGWERRWGIRRLFAPALRDGVEEMALLSQGFAALHPGLFSCSPCRENGRRGFLDDAESWLLKIDN
jgi:hypothetical protein